MSIFDLINEKTKIRGRFILGAIVFAIIVLIGIAFDFAVQMLEFNEIGAQYSSLYLTDFKVKYITMAVAFVFIYIMIWLTNIIIKRNLKKFFIEEKIEPKKLPNNSIAFLIALVTSFFVKDFLAENILLYLNSTSFEIADPIFYKDIGYYIFQRPFLINFFDFIKGSIIAIIAYSIAYYVLAFGVYFNGINIKSLRTNGVVAHNVINVILFLIVIAISYQIDAESILFSNFRGYIGAGFTEVNIQLWMYKLSPWLVILTTILAVFFLGRGKWKKAVSSVLVVPALWVIVFIAMWATQTFYVLPNEFNKESQYIKNNIDYTRQAYNLVGTEESAYPVSTVVDASFVTNNKPAIDNIKITDYESTLKVLNQTQAIRGYYEFNDSDIATYNINGVDTAVLVSPREIKTEDMNYINRKFQYTHGFGAVLNPVNKVTKEGEPEFILKDIKNDLSYGNLKIAEPRIYYGELTDDYVFVNANGINEIDYPIGDEAVETRYMGDGGIPMTLGNRILMAMKNLDVQMLVSGYINNETRLLPNRNIIDRVEKVAPFLKFDKDAYMVLDNNGTQYWVVDGYTVSPYYPYAQYFEMEGKLKGTTEKYNYIRNSVKAIVNAYTGEVKLYIIDRGDPIVMAYRNIYPEIFADLDTDEISDDIWSHIRYPEFLFNIQAQKLEKYHVTDVSAFYKGEDTWAIATHQTGEGEERLEPDYNIITLPGKYKPELTLTIPYTPSQRQLLTSWLAVSSNRSEYGKLRIYKFPKESNVLGTIQLDNKIDQDAQISQDLNLWNGKGSKVVRQISVVPIGNTLMYVEPIYLEAVNENAIPQLKKIVVAFNDNLAIGDTLEDAINQLISQTGTIKIEQSDVNSLKNLVEQTLATYNNVKTTSQTGSWEQFGKEMDNLGVLLEQLNARKEEIQ